MTNLNKKKRTIKFDLSVWQVITLGYLFVISLGTLLLCLPIANRAGVWTNFFNSLFTATSATCVTGLIIYDTFSHWTTFGHIVILMLIQVGGVGFMTIITSFYIVLRKKIGLFERKLIMTSAGTDRLSGNVSLIRKIVAGTVIFEGFGTILLAIRFCKDFGFGRGLWFASFHAISAFCNAGIDLMGYIKPMSSLTNYASDPLVMLTIGALIFIGGIGFIVWSDMIANRFRPKKFSLHTKVALYSSLILIGVSALIFFLLEKDNPATMKNQSSSTRFLSSLFMATTPRTAGFNSIETSSLTGASKFFTMSLMLIGGCPGSTAGGIKITTFVVILAGFVSMARNRNDIVVGKKRIDAFSLRHALVIFCAYITTISIAVFILQIADKLPLQVALFKSFSAIGTVGLSIGPNEGLSVVSKLTVTLLMMIGRVGVLTIALAFGEKKKQAPIRFGADKIHIG